MVSGGWGIMWVGGCLCILSLGNLSPLPVGGAGWVYCMMATAGVSLLERERRYGEAVERLQQLLGVCACLCGTNTCGAVCLGGWVLCVWVGGCCVSGWVVDMSFGT